MHVQTGPRQHLYIILNHLHKALHGKYKTIANTAGYCGPKNVFQYIAISKKVLQYSKTRLQRISGDTSKNFVIAVIRYIDIAKFVILYNEFVLHKENKPGTMNRC